MKKSLALMLALIMVLCMLPTTALAASWKPDDKITITVDVFDNYTNTIYRNVATDTITKGDEKIQSDNYRIKELSELVPGAKYGRITQVTGNWYGVYSSCNVGTNVVFSCNANTARITYWVNGWNTGSGGTSSEKEDLGGDGRYTINFSIVYHSNYPDGTDHTVTKEYTVKNYANTYTVFASQFKSYREVGFGGYTPKVSENTWYRAADCAEVAGAISAKNGGTYHLYAGWKTESATTITLTYKSADGLKTYGTVNTFANEEITIAGTDSFNPAITNGEAKFLGWAETANATEATYKAGQQITLTGSKILYAVWEENITPPTTDKPEPPKPENPAELTSFVKSRITVTPDNMPTLPEGVTFNTDSTVTFNDNSTTANLLYSFTVKGTPGAKVVIKDDRATFIDNGKSEITVTLPAAVENETETSTTVYGYRTFSVDDIQDGKLVNNATANVEGGDNNKKEAKAEVDAKDDRTLKNTLTVKKLVSGNAANPTEKFTFKATFTFPVPANSPSLDDVTSGEKVEITFELAHGQARTFSYKSDEGLKTKIDNWMKESGSLSGDGDAVFAMLSYKVEETNAKGYTLATSGDAESKAEGHNTVTFTNTKNKPNDDHGGHYHPTTTPVPVIVIPPKTGDMTIWQSILHFLGIR